MRRAASTTTAGLRSAAVAALAATLPPADANRVNDVGDLEFASRCDRRPCGVVGSAVTGRTVRRVLPSWATPPERWGGPHRSAVRAAMCDVRRIVDSAVVTILLPL